MEFILRQLENPNFIINFATFITFLIIVMVVINIYDYIKIMLPFWRIERRYKKELESLRKK
jgi:flagellar biosynthesis protein FliP